MNENENNDINLLQNQMLIILSKRLDYLSDEIKKLQRS